MSSHAPSQGSKPKSRRTQNASQFHHSCVWLLTSRMAAPLPSHSSLPPSSLCSGRASHSEQQAAGGDDIICTAAHCSIGSEQRHVSRTLTISSLPPSIFQSSSPTSAHDAALSPPPESRSQSRSGARRFFPSRVSTCWMVKKNRRGRRSLWGSNAGPSLLLLRAVVFWMVTFSPLTDSSRLTSFTVAYRRSGCDSSPQNHAR